MKKRGEEPVVQGDSVGLLLRGRREERPEKGRRDSGSSDDPLRGGRTDAVLSLRFQRRQSSGSRWFCESCPYPFDLGPVFLYRLLSLENFLFYVRGGESSTGLSVFTVVVDSEVVTFGSQAVVHFATSGRHEASRYGGRLTGRQDLRWCRCALLCHYSTSCRKLPPVLPLLRSSTECYSMSKYLWTSSFILTNWTLLCVNVRRRPLETG